MSTRMYHDIFRLQDQVEQLTRRVTELESAVTPPPEAIRFTVTGSSSDLDLLPTRAYSDDAGWDLRSAEYVQLKPGEIALVPTGVRVELAPGTFGMMCSRSGLVAGSGIAVANAPGIIDAGYRGELLVTLINYSSVVYHVSRGDRIAQLVLGRTDLTAVADGGGTLESSERGAGGHGSSGR